MSETHPRFWDIFFEVFEALPRQGPGNRASAERALSLCRDLPPSPAVLDLGCGTGGQTLYLAELTGGSIVAVDNHAPSIARLTSAVAGRGLSQRVQPIAGDIADLQLPPGGFDLIWSEGALYNIGIAKALQICRRLVRPAGYLVFTDAVWRTANPPPEVKAGFDLDYPDMGQVDGIIDVIQACEFEFLGHFALPDEAWWDDFYTPMERRIEALRAAYDRDAEACAILDELAREPEMHRQYAGSYGYEFFVARRPRCA